MSHYRVSLHRKTSVRMRDYFELLYTDKQLKPAPIYLTISFECVHTEKQAYHIACMREYFQRLYAGKYVKIISMCATTVNVFIRENKCTRCLFVMRLLLVSLYRKITDACVCV